MYTLYSDSLICKQLQGKQKWHPQQQTIFFFTIEREILVSHGGEYEDGLLIALMMEAASTSKKSVNFYQTTRRNNQEDSHLHTTERYDTHEARTATGHSQATDGSIYTLIRSRSKQAQIRLHRANGRW
jgi:hypothetical protein